MNRESKQWVVDENVAETIATGSQAGEGRKVKLGGTDAQSVPARQAVGEPVRSSKG